MLRKQLTYALIVLAILINLLPTAVFAAPQAPDGTEIGSVGTDVAWAQLEGTRIVGKVRINNLTGQKVNDVVVNFRLNGGEIHSTSLVDVGSHHFLDINFDAGTDGQPNENWLQHQACHDGSCSGWAEWHVADRRTTITVRTETDNCALRSRPSIDPVRELLYKGKVIYSGEVVDAGEFSKWVDVSEFIEAGDENVYIETRFTWAEEGRSNTTRDPLPHCKGP